ncbi:unnamed protein product [marine sediment metagenome]|uniref:Uncharacterized protein n=1 Tax=marine sediment metagenome TaxID=412755 RepID=X1T2E0_9ZZZZ
MESNPININRLMWLGAGAGSKGILAGMVSGFAPQAGITPDIAGLFIGFFLAQQGGERLGVFGEGMLIASLGQLVRQPIEGIFGRIAQPETTTTPTTTTAAAAAEASQRARRTRTLTTEGGRK